MASQRCVVKKVGKCVVVRLVSENKENRINPEFLVEFNRALDQAESYDDATCLVTISDGKYYCLGFDLVLATSIGPAEMTQCVADTQRLYSRLLTFPLVTVAAVNGHMYAGGALLAVCHDYIVMNSRKGFFCMPEINLKLRFPDGLLELAKAKFPQREHNAILVLGKRYGGEDAQAASIVDEVCPLAELRDTAIAAAGKLAGQDGLDRRTLVALKRDLYRDILQALSKPPKLQSRL